MRKLYKKGILKKEKPPVKVISIGNIAFGGTGKTTLVMYIAKFLVENGFKVAVISRGYRGKLEKAGGEVSLDSSRCWEMYGDEPCLIKEKLGVPVFVGKDRVSSIRSASEKYGIDIAIMDDGFQYLKVEKVLDILILSGKEVDALILREPLKPSLEEADLIVSRKDIKGLPKEKTFLFEISLDKIHPELRQPEKPLAFSGIGNNPSFIELLKSAGINPVGHIFFRDHVKYSNKTIKKIVHKARKLGAKSLVTTEKDYVKVKDFSISIPIFYVSTKIRIEKESEFLSRILLSVTQ